jgi:uncharacterized protein (DUF697 family)
MEKMTKVQFGKCHAAIHTASVAAAGVGAGLAQLPGSDSVPIVAIQVAMTVTLGAIFNIQVSKSAAKGAVLTALAASTGPVVARMGTQFLIGWLPGVGNTVNAVTAAALTEAIGWLIAKEFHKESLETAKK